MSVALLPKQWRDTAEAVRQRAARAMFNPALSERQECLRNCANDLERALKNTWVNVKDRLPEDGEVVLCYESRKGNMFVSQFMKEMPGGKPGFVEEFYEKSPTTDGCPGGWGHWPFVTYWQPLPEPPPHE